MSDAEARVRDFLATMERRDLVGAKAFLAPGFTMTFPGNRKFTQLEELVAFGSSRYRSVGKKYDRFDNVTDGDTAIVYCFGTLFGEWLDGRAFEGIRFIDRFTVREGLFVDQLVWNDLGEVALSSD